MVEYDVDGIEGVYAGIFDTYFLIYSLLLFIRLQIFFEVLMSYLIYIIFKSPNLIAFLKHGIFLIIIYRFYSAQQTRNNKCL